MTEKLTTVTAPNELVLDAQEFLKNLAVSLSTIEAQNETILQQQEEIIEKLDNLSLSGEGFGVEEL